jgi:GATA-binding protein, other eukaryote
LALWHQQKEIFGGAWSLSKPLPVLFFIAHRLALMVLAPSKISLSSALIIALHFAYLSVHRTYLGLIVASNHSLRAPFRNAARRRCRIAAIMATMANNDRETTQPTCQNCQTSTTPLWRRDEMGAVLCNACGLFLKLHGRPRPISLKTDVIKSRNRVKTMRPDLAKQKKVCRHPQRLDTPLSAFAILDGHADQTKQNQALNPADMNGADFTNQGNGAAAANARRASQRSANGTHDDTNSPISRTGTPNMYAAHQLYPNIDDQFQPQHLPSFGVSTASDGRAPSPLNGELSRTHEQIIADNASLKTRVSELEVIQELYRGRIQQLEQEENARREAPDAAKTTEEQFRAQIAVLTDQILQLHKNNEESRQNYEESQKQLQKQLDESHRRENMLKRRLDELEVELKDSKASLELHENGRAKKPRLDNGTAAPAEAAPEVKADVA